MEGGCELTTAIKVSLYAALALVALSFLAFVLATCGTTVTTGATVTS
jgi:hypothetical protein